MSSSAGSDFEQAAAHRGVAFGDLDNDGKIDAVVSVLNGQYNEVTTAVGYACSSDSRVHFGLGSAKTIREIEIRWPSRIRQVLHNIAADQILSLTEPAS